MFLPLHQKRSSPEFRGMVAQKECLALYAHCAHLSAIVTEFTGQSKLLTFEGIPRAFISCIISVLATLLQLFLPQNLTLTSIYHTFKWEL
ncbi:unnamed protein product [Brugia pahangi]|uniref:Ovule protein n=1 Tax=Brugia pahangi TaxID=6280 RepID=A0A0N4SYJ7_BRUPA|nr:unnamed protein product [Brugia pahangi]